MTWKCVIMVPHVHVIEYARDLETAQKGAESLRANYREVKGAMADPLPLKEGSGQDQMTYYPVIVEISGPSEPITEHAKAVAPKEAVVPTLTLEPEPPSGPAAA